MNARGALLGACLVLAIAACEAEPPRPPAPDFIFPDLQGRPVRLSELRGRTVVIDFFDRSGTLTRTQVHVDEQDTFSANGKSLASMPFTYEVTIRFDSSGNITVALLNGNIVKVLLPDGGLFISAGRVDLLARGLPQFLVDLTPDVGATVNLDRFCAALAP